MILKTALSAAIPLSAHLDFLHAHVPSTLAFRHANLDYAMGDGLKKAFVRLDVNPILSPDSRQRTSARFARAQQSRCATGQPTPKM